MTTYDGFSSGGRPGYHRYSADTLITSPRVDELDLVAAIGQRSATYGFNLIDGVTQENLGQIYPLNDQPASITHDTSRTIKRDLSIALAAADVAEVNTLTDRIEPFMTLAGVDWPLGRFMFTGDTIARRTGGDDGSYKLMDEMALVDQEISTGFTSTGSCDQALRELVAGLNLPKGVVIAASKYPAAGAWRIGSRRGQIATTLCVLGDLETPWFDNDGVMRSIQVVDPSIAVPDLDLDAGYQIFSDTISESNDLIDAPNRFVVIGIGSASVVAPIVGTYDVPSTAPHSIARRGFVLQMTKDLQVKTVEQAKAAAKAIGMTYLPVQQADMSIAPDPRFDSYQVVRYRGENWLNTVWTMPLEPGGSMDITLRRSYLPT